MEDLIFYTQWNNKIYIVKILAAGLLAGGLTHEHYWIKFTFKDEYGDAIIRCNDFIHESKYKIKWVYYDDGWKALQDDWTRMTNGHIHANYIVFEKLRAILISEKWKHTIYLREIFKEMPELVDYTIILINEFYIFRLSVA